MTTISSIKWLLPFLAIPILFLVLSIIYYYKQPKKINLWYGYRTSASMKNQDTWKVANQTAAECFLYTSIGFVMVLAVFLLVLGKAGVIKWFGSLQSLFLIIVICSTLLVLMPIVVTEYKLKKIFASNGQRR